MDKRSGNFTFVRETIETKIGRITYLLGIPQLPHRKGPLLLLNVAMGRERTLQEQPFSLISEHLLAQGHYALSLDLPCHGDWTNSCGEGITGIAGMVEAGDDPFTAFTEAAQDVLSHALQGHASDCQNTVLACGTSRGAYFALRLAAADQRISRIAAMAPVTDWRFLKEFASIQTRDDVAELTLSRMIPQLLGRSVFMTIGYADARVSTASCAGFYAQLHEQNRLAGHEEAEVTLYISEDEGHQLDDKWYRKGAEFLLGQTL